MLFLDVELEVFKVFWEKLLCSVWELYDDLLDCMNWVLLIMCIVVEWMCVKELVQCEDVYGFVVYRFVCSKVEVFGELFECLFCYVLEVFGDLLVLLLIGSVLFDVDELVEFECMVNG